MEPFLWELAEFQNEAALKDLSALELLGVMIASDLVIEGGEGDYGENSHSDEDMEAMSTLRHRAQKELVRRNYHLAYYRDFKGVSAE